MSPTPPNNDPNNSNNQTDGFWDKSVHKKQRAKAQAAELAKPGAREARRRSKRRTILLITAGSTLTLLLLGIALAPTIAGSIAPGLIASQAAKSINGTVAVQRTSLSWFGPQRVGPLTVTDDQGHLVASLTAEVSAGLLGFATGSLNVGTVTITDPHVRIERFADGSTNIQRLLKAPTTTTNQPPSTPATTPPTTPAQKPSIPPSLKGTLAIKGLDATFIDHTNTPQGAPVGSASAVVLDNADLAAELAVGKPLTGRLVARAAAGHLAKGATDPVVTPSGRIDANIQAARWSDAQGVIDPATAELDATLTIENLPTAILDAVLGRALPTDPNAPRQTLAQGLGPALNVNAKVVGTIDKATATLDARLDHAQVGVDVAIDGGVLTARRPITLAVQGRAIEALVPQAAAAKSASDLASIDALPDIALSVSRLSLPMPRDGKPLDLRQASLQLALTTTSVTGRARLAPDQPEQALALAPLTLSIDAPTVGQGVTINGSTRATLDQAPAGELTIDLAATGLLDATGAPKAGLPSDIRGQVAITGIATAIAQPFVASLGLDLPRDLGPKLDLAVRAQTAASTTSIDLDASSQFLRVRAPITIAPDRIAAREPITLRAERALAIAAALMPKEGGLALRPEGGSGPVSLTVSRLNLPMDAQGPKLDQLDAAFETAIPGLSVTTAASPEPITIQGLSASGSLTGNALATTLASRGSFAGQPFTIDADVRAPDLLVASTDAAGARTFGPNSTTRPIATITLADVPTALAGLAGAGGGGNDGRPALDLAQVARDAVGPRLSAVIKTEPGPDQGLAASVTARAERLAADLALSLSATRLDLRSGAINLTPTPQSYANLMSTFAPGAELPRLASDTLVRIAVEPFSLPMKPGFAPDLQSAQPIKAKVTMGGQTVFTGLPLEGAPAGTLAGVENLVLDVVAPVAGLVGAAGGERAALSADLTTRLIGRAGAQGAVRPLADLTTNIRGTMSQAKPVGETTLAVRLTDLNTRAIEAMLARPGLISGAAGDTANLDARASVTPPPGEAIDPATATVELRATIRAPRVSTEGPVAVSMSPQRIALLEPARMRLEVMPEFLAGLMAPPTDGQAPAMSLTAPATINVNVSSLSLPRAAGAGPLQAVVDASIPTLDLRDGQQRPIRLNNTTVTVRGQDVRAGQPVDFALGVGEARVAEGPPVQDMGVKGSVLNLVDESGAIRPDLALVTATADMPAVPTLLVDVLANQDGLLVDALGEVVGMKAAVDRFPVAGPKAIPAGVVPSVQVRMESARATASAGGVMREGAFVLDRPLDVRVVELIQPLSARFISGLPMVGTLEKTPQDAPAAVASSDLRLPLDGDMTKLNGVVTIDPGEARFSTSSAFGQILKVVQQRQAGVIGRRIEPITLRMERGVVRYDRWKLPLGEFTVETEGTVDLVARTIDVTTWAPFGSLADGAVGSLNLGLGSALGRAVPVIDALTMIPIRTRGSLDNPTTSVDAEAVARELVKNLRPDELIKQGLEGGLKDLLRPRPQGTP